MKKNGSELYLPASLDQKRMSEIFSFSPKRKRDFIKALLKKKKALAKNFESDFDGSLYEFLGNPKYLHLYESIAQDIEKSNHPLSVGRAVTRNHILSPPLSENTEAREQLLDISASSSSIVEGKEVVAFLIEQNMITQAVELCWIQSCPMVGQSQELVEKYKEVLSDIVTSFPVLEELLEPMLQYLDHEISEASKAEEEASETPGWSELVINLREQVTLMDDAKPDLKAAQSLQEIGEKLLKAAERHTNEPPDLESFRKALLRFSALEGDGWTLESPEQILNLAGNPSSRATKDAVKTANTYLNKNFDSLDNQKKGVVDYQVNLPNNRVPTPDELKQLTTLNEAFHIELDKIQSKIKEFIAELFEPGESPKTEQLEPFPETTGDEATSSDLNEKTDDLQNERPEDNATQVDEQVTAPPSDEDSLPEKEESTVETTPDGQSIGVEQSWSEETNSDSDESSVDNHKPEQFMDEGSDSNSQNLVQEEDQAPTQENFADTRSQAESEKGSDLGDLTRASLEEKIGHLIAGGRFGTAYWLTWSADLLQMESPIAKGLLGAISVANSGLNQLTLTSQFQTFASEILGLDHLGQNERLLASTAVVTAALNSGEYVHNEGQFHSLASLNLNTTIEELGELTNFVADEIIRHGWTPQYKAKPDGPGSTVYENELKALANESREFLESLPKVRFRYQPAHRALLELFSKDSDFRLIMETVAKSNQNPSPRTTKRTENLLKNLEPEQIVSNYKEFTALSSPLQGSARTQFLNKLKSAQSIGARWVLLSKNKQEAHESSSKELDSKLANLIVRAIAALDSEKEKEPLTKSILIGCARSLENTLRFLKGEIVDLNLGFSNAVMHIPDIELDENYELLEDEAAKFVNLGSFEPKSLEDLVSNCIERQEYARALEICLDSPNSETLQNEILSAKSKEISRLLNQSTQSEEDVEEANLLGLLSEELAGQSKEISDELIDSQDSEGSPSASRTILLNQIHDAREQLEAAEGSISIDIRMARESLDQLALRLNSIKARRQESLENEICGMLPKIPDSGSKEEDVQYIKSEMADFLQAGDSVALAELSDSLRASIEKDEQIARLQMVPGSQVEDFFRVFENLQSLQKIGNARLLRALDQGANIGPLMLSQRSKPHRDDALVALKSWQRIKNLKSFSRGNESLRLAVANIFKFLGLGESSNVLRTEPKTNIDVGFFTLAISQLVRCPVPSFGSELGGALPVVVFRNKTLPVKIMDEIRRNHKTKAGIVVVHMGLISQKQRLTFRDLCIRNKKACVLLDFNLLVHLFGVENPTKTFFDIALPLTWAQPYLMTGENVPPEMFVGRDREIHDLLDQEGPCIVYGGRQLGKSALLRHLASIHHSPADGLYIAYQDVDDLGNPPQKNSDMERELWMRIYQELLHCGFVSKGEVQNLVGKVTKGTATNKVKELVKGKFQSDKSARLIILLDETDDMLDMDSSEGFRIVRQFRSLMAETDRRFKVVFTGLKSVQRYKNYANQPFTQLGSAIVIRPLPPKAAQNLVQVPMQVLGFSFAESSLILRVLSQSNYHPGLVQIFCYRLLENLNESRNGDAAHQRIQRSDVNRVERNVDFMEDIRDRFNWTLDLDERYKVLIYALVLSNAATLQHSVAQFIDIGREWWQRVFEGMELQTMRGLLDEMEGLGVLLQVNVGDQRYYRLRSPNLLRLLGSKSDIESEMENIISRVAPTKRNPKNFHLQIDKKNRIFGPLTMEQDSHITDRSSPFRISYVHGSSVLGIQKVPEHIQSLLESNEDGINRWVEIKVPQQIVLAGIARLVSFLKEKLRKQSRTHLYAICDLSELPDDVDHSSALKSMIAELGKVCRDQTKGKIILLADEDMSWKLVCDSQFQKFVTEEDRVDKIHLKRWSDGAISMALDRIGYKTRSDNNGLLIFEKTQGLHSLVKETLVCLDSDKSSVTKDQIESSFEAAMQKIMESGSSKRLNVRDSNLRNITSELLDLAASDTGQVPWDSAVELLAESEPELLSDGGISFRRWLTIIGVVGPASRKGYLTVAPIARQFLQ